MPLFFVHYKLPQGAAIRTTSRHLAEIESWLVDRDEVVSVAAFVRQGATRFMLTSQAEQPDPSYGHLIVRTRGLETIPALRAGLEAFAGARFPEAEL